MAQISHIREYDLLADAHNVHTSLYDFLLAKYS